MLRIRCEELHGTLAGAFRKLGFDEERALLCARFVRMIRAGRIVCCGAMASWNAGMANAGRPT
jgi:hypothetical protein